MKIKDMTLTLLLMLSFSVNSFASTDCFTLMKGRIYSPLLETTAIANQTDCMATRQRYQCEKLENDLEDQDKIKLIKCDMKSLNTNNIADANLFSCVWNGLAISGEGLLDLTKLPNAIAEVAIKGFKETQECNKSTDKKRQLLNAFNLSIPDKRFKLEESFLGRSFSDMPCSELEKLLGQRYENYKQQVDRELRAAKLTGKKYVIPDELVSKKPEILISLDQVFAEAGIFYNCYTPKAKAELTCTAVTNLLSDIALGAGFVKAVSALKAFHKSKRVLSRINKENPIKKTNTKKYLADEEIVSSFINPELQAVQKELAGDYISFEARDSAGKSFPVPARILERLSDGSREFAYKISYIEPDTGLVKTVKLTQESIAKLNVKSGDKVIAKKFEEAAKKDSLFVEPIFDFKLAEKEANAAAKLKAMAEEEKRSLISGYISTAGMEISEVSFAEFEAAQAKKIQTKSVGVKKSSDDIDFNLSSKDKELAQKAKEEIKKKIDADNTKKLYDDLKNIQPDQN